jgi:hypothetical protein
VDLIKLKEGLVRLVGIPSFEIEDYKLERVMRLLDTFKSGSIQV